LFKKYLKLFIFTIIYIIPIYIKLKKNDIKEIFFFNFLKWHNGYCYFIGIYLEKKVFIKIDTKLHLLVNDKLAYNLCRDLMQDDLVDILHYSLDGKIQFVVYEFFNGNVLDESTLFNNFEYLDDIVGILNNLSNTGVIHRDIKLDNFLVSNNKLKIIDFTFSNSNIHKDFKDLNVKDSHNCFLLEFLGSGFNPSPFVWDDYYSFYTILKKLEENGNDTQKVKINTYVKEIEKNVGQTEYSIKYDSKYYYYSRKLKIKIKDKFRIDHKYRKLH
jgi:serine/threonine protein kinase